MSNLLLDESPLVIQPQLAAKIGLNEAIFIQQVHYWLQRSKNEIDGHMWSYNTYEQLQEQFPFWSIRTIKTISKNLKDQGILLIEKLSKDKWDKTNFYSISYDELNRLIDSANVAQSRECKDNTIDSANVAQSLIDKTETSTETSTENIKKINQKKFSFRLSRSTSYESLSKEYQDKLWSYAALKDQALNFNDFIDYHGAKGTKFKNWSLAYNTWLSNSKKFGGLDPKDFAPKPVTIRVDGENRTGYVIGDIAVFDDLSTMHVKREGSS